MSIPIPISPKELKLLERELAKKQRFVVLDETVHIKALLVAQARLSASKPVKAKIVKGYN